MSRLAQRGSKLEMLINMTNNEYKNSNFADIRKVPTPLKIKSVKGKKVDATLGRAEWVDYCGIFRGKSILFDAKESEIERFPLANLAQHQYEQLRSWHEKGGLAFLVVAFWLKGKNEPEIYMLNFERLDSFWKLANSGGRKSIPIEYFRNECPRIKSANGYTAHYLLVVEY